MTIVADLGSGQSENFDHSSLTKMLISSEKSAEGPEDFNWKERICRFIVIAACRYALVALSVLTHALIFFFGLMHYDNRIDESTIPRKTSVAPLIADASTIVLHFDLAIVLLPLCRTLISLLERTCLCRFLRNDYAVRGVERVTSHSVQNL